MEDRKDSEVESAITAGSIPETLQIRLDEAALAQAREMAGASEHAGKALRFYLDGKGCDGFFYGVAFDRPAQGDLAYSQDGLAMIVDTESFRFMHSSTVAWVDDELGRGFIVTNPNHRRYRGKFFKKAAWKTKLAATSSDAAAQ
jgi:iron-sulfur cluster insertion protein